MAEVNESYLNQIYQTLISEQMTLTQSLNRTADDFDLQKKVQKKMSALNNLIVKLIVYKSLIQNK